jgi:hypothetical protein
MKNVRGSVSAKFHPLSRGIIFIFPSTSFLGDVGVLLNPLEMA